MNGRGCYLISKSGVEEAWPKSKGSKNSNGNAFLVQKWCLYEVNEERRGRCCCDNAIGTEGDRLAEFQNWSEMTLNLISGARVALMYPFVSSPELRTAHNLTLWEKTLANARHMNREVGCWCSIFNSLEGIKPGPGTVENSSYGFFRRQSWTKRDHFFVLFFFRNTRNMMKSCRLW